MILYTNSNYPTEIHDVVKLFFPDSVLGGDNAEILLLCSFDGNKCSFEARYNGAVEHTFVDISNVDELQSIRLQKRYAKICIYNCLKNATGKSMPWGSLTGIRPTKLARQLQSEGLDFEKTFTELLGVSAEKTKLVKDILNCQQGLYSISENTADLYVGIPFCVTRCSYCSFTSGEIERLKKYVEPYVDALCVDVAQTLCFAKERGIGIRNVYFGGGTPTSLTASQLEHIFKIIDVKPVEFTVEAGRPDTIDEEKLALFQKYGVNRISINPQTFNQSVLDAVGRRHTVQDIYDKYQMAKKYNLTINMDLIAGLPEETYEMFCHSIDSAIALSPQNITVHTLALKHGSNLKQENYASEYDVGKMVEYAHKRLYEEDYLPYYMYRQKYVCENLENVGFTKKGDACLYNIDIMEEVSNILACGTNAISKKITLTDNRIERSANAKDVITYINSNETYLQRKFELFSEKQ